MKIYESLASIYDQTMDNIPYTGWCEAICEYLKKNGITGHICELGCGTGAMTELLAEQGFKMTGIDLSDQMLQIAMEKKIETGSDIEYVKQDIRDFSLHTPVDAMISVCDTMNYMLSEQELTNVFHNTHKYLKKDGLFIFDLKTIHCYINMMGNQVWAEQNDNGYYIWENYFHEDSNLNEYVLTIFKQAEGSELYERTEEVHCQKAYELDYIKVLLEESGFEFAEAFGEQFGESITEKSERYFVVARRKN